MRPPECSSRSSPNTVRIPLNPPVLKSGELFQRQSHLHLHNHLQTEI